ncbi:MAG: uroporphyrinogen decarboxylase family protein [Verrucomicrobia bacterium]|nr:uroporphyrinogen decarboxylase family protein [Verrucomicrobiota bacterium]
MPRAAIKLERMRKALAHQEGDRVPAGEFFWTGFMNRCRAVWGREFDPYRYFDLDYVVVSPNMDPRLRPFEVLKQSGDDILIKTGFGATIRRSGDKPMPHYESFSVTAPEQMADFGFDDPANPRRFFEGGDDQINCVGDTLTRNIPSWEARFKPYQDEFPIFGSVCEPYEYLWRVIGTENALFWMASDPEALAAFVDRIGKFMLELGRAQIRAGQGRLAGMYIWGDVAYGHGMLFGAPRWRTLFKPHVKALIDLFHANELLVIYHGCGNAKEILDDMVELHLDAYNPLEAKAGLDVVELKKQFAGRLAFVGNIDMRVLESNDPVAIRREILYKLQAARGGGWIFQSDHSVSSDVAPESYALAIQTLREHGNFPLKI